MWKALDIDAWLAGRQSSLEEVRASVLEIIEKVRTRGDSALRELSRHYTLEEIAISNEEREEAYDQVDAKIIESLIEAEARITRFHELQRPRDLWLQEVEKGTLVKVQKELMDELKASEFPISPVLHSIATAAHTDEHVGFTLGAARKALKDIER